MGVSYHGWRGFLLRYENHILQNKKIVWSAFPYNISAGRWFPYRLCPRDFYQDIFTELLEMNFIQLL